MRKYKMYKSFKFRLALAVSIVLLGFASVIILLFNVAINNYLSTRQQSKAPTQQSQNSNQQQSQPIKDDKDRLRAQYSKDLETVQRTSAQMLIFFAIISLIVGYFIADKFLRPLSKLNSKLGELSHHNLGAQIIDVPDNEFGDTVSHFNAMSSRLKNAFAQQEQFIQDASHELRTPLTIMRTNLDTVLDNPKASRDELRRSMQEALGEIDYATNLANDLLTLTKMPSTKKPVFAVSDILSEIVDKYRHVTKNSKLIIELNIADDELYIRANKLDIMRAISNILDNAIKYSSSEKKPKVLINLRRVSDRVSIVIQDNGPGIPNKYQPIIFDRFIRADASRARKTGGFGLGLAISKKIINENQGTINLSSKPHQTIFEITLPCSDQV